MTPLEEFTEEARSTINAFDGWVILDHGCRSAEEIARDIVSFAMCYGFDAQKQDINSENYSEELNWIMDEAIDYLSEGVPEGYWIGNDGEIGAFGVFAIEEED